MSAMPFFVAPPRHCVLTTCSVLLDLGRLFLLALRPRAALAAENLFLRKQLALFQERKVKPRRAADSTRWWMATVSRLFDWRAVLVVVKPDTLVRWHRRGFRPFLALEIQIVQWWIREMASENSSWGEERIANELKLKLGIRVSPRTVNTFAMVARPAPLIPNSVG